MPIQLSDHLTEKECRKMNKKKQPIDNQHFFVIDFNYNTQEWNAAPYCRDLWEYVYVHNHCVDSVDRLVYVGY